MDWFCMRHACWSTVFWNNMRISPYFHVLYEVRYFLLWKIQPMMICSGRSRTEIRTTSWKNGKKATQKHKKNKSIKRWCATEVPSAKSGCGRHHPEHELKNHNVLYRLSSSWGQKPFHSPNSVDNCVIPTIVTIRLQLTTWNVGGRGRSHNRVWQRSTTTINHNP